MQGEMKVSDVRNWVLNNKFNNGNPSNQDLWFADMLEKNYSVGLPGWTNRSLRGSWISTWEAEQLFIRFFEDGECSFRAMGCDVPTYFKDNPAIEPSIF